ncbi:MAG: DUF4184 family protein, partial [Actinobacteria bacterium]|nr:DUF4184 family protein [Actinomycetota bacterium]
MPFTPSHAVVALPFLRTPLVPAAIAVGSMTPDLPLFVRGTPLTYGVTHSFAWLPLTIGVALALLLVWRTALRPALRELSPRWLAVRLPGEWDASAARGVSETFAARSSGTIRGGAGQTRATVRALALLAASLAIGVASHITWDMFTHEGRWGTQALPGLDDYWGPLTGFTWLQHGSSLLGLAILGVWALCWLRRADAASSVARVLPTWVRRVWWLSLPVILIAAWVIGFAASGPFTAGFTPAHLAYRVLP